MIGTARSKQPIHISSKNELDREMKQIHQLFKKKENEETWELFDQALKNIKIWATVDKIHQYPGFVDHIKLLQQPIISALNSERTRLAGSANELLQGLSKAMQRKYELIHELFLPTLIKLFSRTNKLHVRHTMTTFKTIVENSKVPRTTHRLCLILRNHNDGNNNNKAVKYHVTECLNTVIQVNATSDLLRYVDDIQDAIRNTAMDPAPEVRSSIRMCYKLYCEKIPTHASKFTDSLSPTILRYLQIGSVKRSISTGLKQRQPLATRSGIPKPKIKASSSSSLSSSRSSSTLSTSSSSSSSSKSPKTTLPRTGSSMTPKSLKTNTSTSLSSPTSGSTIPTTTGYLSATRSSSAKVTTVDKSTIRGGTMTNLRTKYIGDHGKKLTLQPGCRLKPRAMIRGMPAMRQMKANSTSNATNNNNNESVGRMTGTRRTLTEADLQHQEEQDANQKRIKTEID